MVNRYAIIENGIVMNIAMSEPEFAQEQGWVLAPDGVGQGWTYNGSIFSPLPSPTLEEIQVGLRSTMSLSFAQLLIGLVTEAWVTEAEGDAWLVGTLPAPVLALISTLPIEQQFAAKARAIRPSEVMRTDALVVSLGAAQGKTPEELDQFFGTYSGA